jgi:hypothetical protein
MKGWLIMQNSCEVVKYYVKNKDFYHLYLISAVKQKSILYWIFLEVIYWKKKFYFKGKNLLFYWKYFTGIL